MKKLLAVFNTCQIGHGNQVPYYIDAIRSLLRQSVVDKWGSDFQIAISGCMINEPTKNTLRELFGNHITCNYVDENVPVSVTFNDTVDKCVKHFGEYEGYLYIDSGINFWDPSNRYDALEIMYDVFKSGPYALCSAMPSNDDGSQWWGIKYQIDQDYVFPVGKTTNLHCQIFSEEWRKAYNRILPDIFASNCMESVFTCMASAIQRKFIMTQKVSVLHLHSLDGASIGNRDPKPDRYPMSNTFETGGQFFKKSKTLDEMYMEGHEFGFGIEECKEYWRHDPTKFDANGYAIDIRLKEFLAHEMYLNENEFSYKNLVTTFIPGK